MIELTGRVHECRYIIPFDSHRLPQVFTDVLVIGTGVAGATAAQAAVAEDSDVDVIVLSKKQATLSNTAWAQGGIAAVWSEQDSFQSHIYDTLAAGGDLCDAPAVETVVGGATQAIETLLAQGMHLDRTEQGSLVLGREGGHKHSRIVHSHGDATGVELVRTCVACLHDLQQVRLFEECFVIDLLTDENGVCCGALTYHEIYGLQVIWASRGVVLAGGGAGRVWRESTNPATATGDALAMAWRAGASLMDMAFVQFHPTTLYIAGAARSLITEAIRGEGAHLVDCYGHRFMPDYDERAELAPRDVVSQAILKQMVKTNYSHVYLDVRPIGEQKFKARFPNIASLLAEYDIDPMSGRIPVHPSCHYMIGGVRTDLQGATDVSRLWACGEASCTGLNGANRLASNSLLEGLVMGGVCGRNVAKAAARQVPVKIIHDGMKLDRIGLDIDDVQRSVRSLMWRHVGIEREQEHLQEVTDLLRDWSRYSLGRAFDYPKAWQLQNILTVASLVTQAALWREESRGTHCRIDYTQTVETFAVHDLWRRGQYGPQTQAVQR